jgi:hypothetical protein
MGAAAVHGRIWPSLPSTRRGTRAYAAGFSRRRTASARTLTTWWRCRTGSPVDWILMVEWDIRTVRMPGQPIAAGTPFGAMALLCARLIFPAVVPLTDAVTLAGWSCADPRCLPGRLGPGEFRCRGVRGAGAPGALAAGVNPGVEIGVNPDSRPWADAPDGCRAAR